jgi:hypothetical protein
MTTAEQAHLIGLLAEAAARRKEALRLYQPWPVQQEFHASPAPLRLVRGSNRAGKTLSVATELARAVTGQDPHGKYPAKGRAIIVGPNLLHCSKVWFRKIFRESGMKILRDRRTQEWRTFRPDEDAGLEHLTEDAPPLIPGRFYRERDISWEDKREEIARTVRLKTGWEMSFFSGEGRPPQGWDVDLILFDEEIVHPAWYPEMVPRLVDRAGRFIWAFTPQSGTITAWELHERAEELKGEPNPRVQSFFMEIAANPYISEANKESFRQDLAHDEDEYKVRVLGDFALKGLRVYPEFAKKGAHKIATFPIPDDWTRYVAIDPGRQVSAALFLAVPAPKSALSDRPVVYGEVYSKKTDAMRFAREMKEFLGNSWVHDWLIDHHQGCKHEGSGMTVEELYAQEFARAGLKANGFRGFIWAADDVAAGKLAAKGKLQYRDGAPEWLFMVEKLPWFCWEIDRYVDKRITKGGNIVDDTSRSNLHNHLMDCFDHQTEVLTEYGWVGFPHLVNTRGIALATVNLETDLIEYQQASEIFARWHNGEMVRIHGRKLDALVTPNHRMVVYKQGHNTPSIRLAGELNAFDRIKLHATWAGTKESEDFWRFRLPDCDPGVFCEMLGWYAAEGCCYEDWNETRGSTAYQVMICQSKEDGRSRLRELLARTPWNWVECANRFEASSKELFGLLEELGVGKGAARKRVPDLIGCLSPDLIDRYLEGTTLGDGWKQAGRRSIATISSELADGLQQLFIKIGKSASIRQVQPKPYQIDGRTGPSQLQYWVSEWNCPHGVLRDGENKPNFSAEPYEGWVYCATVPNGTLIVRRNGKPMIAGNCYRYLALHNIRYVRPPKRPQAKGWAARHVEQKRRRQRETQGWGDAIRLG